MARTQRSLGLTGGRPEHVADADAARRRRGDLGRRRRSARLRDDDAQVLPPPDPPAGAADRIASRAASIGAQEEWRQKGRV